MIKKLLALITFLFTGFAFSEEKSFKIHIYDKDKETTFFYETDNKGKSFSQFYADVNIQETIGKMFLERFNRKYSMKSSSPYKYNTGKKTNPDKEKLISLTKEYGLVYSVDLTDKLEHPWVSMYYLDSKTSEIMLIFYDMTQID
ncbi:MAG: hypothetical protein K6F69_02185 [Treponema sp.]|nr:hypothetical protein [Treponema sp.]